MDKKLIPDDEVFEQFSVRMVRFQWPINQSGIKLMLYPQSGRIEI